MARDWLAAKPPGSRRRLRLAVLPRFDAAGGLIGAIIVAVVGAIILIAILRLIK